MRILFIAIIALTMNACSQKKNIGSATTPKTTTTPEKPSMEEDPVEKVELADMENYDNDCFRGRAVTKEVSDQEASIVKAMSMYMFAFENTRWQPCSVPAEFQMEGLKVKVSGQVLEIKPNERRAGTPFNISNLEKL